MNPISDEEFVAFINSLKMTDLEIAEKLDVSIPTVKSWNKVVISRIG